MTKYKRLNITLPEDLLKEFEEYCKREGMNMSARIAVLIKRDLPLRESEGMLQKYKTLVLDCKKKSAIVHQVVT